MFSLCLFKNFVVIFRYIRLDNDNSAYRNVVVKINLNCKKIFSFYSVVKQK